MRVAFVVLAALAATAFTGSSPASATERSWCAQYAGPLGNSRSCAFISWEQCRLTIDGAGGLCIPNPAYQEVVERPFLVKHYRRHHRWS